MWCAQSVHPQCTMHCLVGYPQQLSSAPAARAFNDKLHYASCQPCHVPCRQCDADYYCLQRAFSHSILQSVQPALFACAVLRSRVSSSAFPCWVALLLLLIACPSIGSYRHHDLSCHGHLATTITALATSPCQKLLLLLLPALLTFRLHKLHIPLHFNLPVLVHG